MQIKQYLVDGNGKAVQIEWENGQRTGIPYYVEHSLKDFDGDGERYALFLDGLTREYEAERIGTLPGEPSRSMFPSEEIYQSRLRMWESELVQDKIIEKHKPPPPSPPPRGPDGFIGLPPDEHRMERLKHFQSIRDWESKLTEARRSGDSNAEDRATYFIKMANKDLEKIPEAVFQRQVKIGMENETRDMISILLDTRFKNDPFFDNPRVSHDIMDALNVYNKMDRGNIIVLPREAAKGTGKAGRYRPLKPGNFVQIDLGSREKKDEFLRHIECGQDPHEWLNVRKLIPEDKEKLSLKELEDVPERMPQKTFETFQATGKVFSEKRLAALSPREREVLNASGGLTWPDRHLPGEEEEPEPEDHSQEEFEASLKPYNPNPIHMTTDKIVDAP